MDPERALEVIINPDSDKIAVAIARRALITWLKQGGFSPRVQTHPATNAWIMGDTYGRVVKVGYKYLHVKLNVSGCTLKFLPSNLLTMPDKYAPYLHLFGE